MKVRDKSYLSDGVLAIDLDFLHLIHHILREFTHIFAISLRDLYHFWNLTWAFTAEEVSQLLRYGSGISLMEIPLEHVSCGNRSSCNT